MICLKISISLGHEYKCISKILCNIYAYCILPDLVNPKQTVFVKGKLLIQNVLDWHDWLRHYKRKTTLRCLMKIDLRKTYDMVKWEFVSENARLVWISTKVSHLLMECVTTTSFSIKVNRERCSFFEGKEFSFLLCFMSWLWSISDSNDEYIVWFSISPSMQKINNQ